MSNLSDKISPAASLVNHMNETADLYGAAVQKAKGDLSALAPSVILQFIVSITNIFNAAAKASEVSDSDSGDSEIFMRSAFCQQEKIVEVIRRWKPNPSNIDDEMEKKALVAVNAFRDKFIEIFDKSHERFHKDKFIDLNFYIDQIIELNGMFSKYPEFMRPRHYDEDGNLSVAKVNDDDVKAILNMAAKFGMEEMQEREVAEAAAIHINSLLKDGKTVKDMEEFDIMNVCLGYCVVTMNADGQKKLGDFIKSCIARDAEMSNPEKYKGSEDGKILVSKLPTYRLSNNRVLVFEPEKLSENDSSEARAQFKEVAKDRIYEGLKEMLKLTVDPSETVKAFVDRREIDKSQESLKEILKWLGPWAGHPVNYPDGLPEGEDLQNADLDNWTGSCAYDASEDYIKEGKEATFQFGMATVIGFMERKGPQGLIQMILKNEFSMVENIKSLSKFEESLDERNFEFDSDPEKQIIRISGKQI